MIALGNRKIANGFKTFKIALSGLRIRMCLQVLFKLGSRHITGKEIMYGTKWDKTA